MAAPLGRSTVRFYVGLALVPLIPALAFVAILIALRGGFEAYLGVFTVLAAVGLLVDLDRRGRRRAAVEQPLRVAGEVESRPVVLAVVARAAQAIGVDAAGTAGAMGLLIGIALLATWLGRILLLPSSALATSGPPSATNATLPAGVALDNHGNVYVTDELNLRVRRLTPTGRTDPSWSNHGSLGGFLWPTRLVVAPNGRVYVADSSAGQIEIYTGQGRFLTAWSQLNNFDYPMGMALDRRGDLYVALAASDRIDELSPRGVLLRSFGALGDAPGQFDDPSGLAVDRAGTIYVLDTLNNRVQKFSPSIRHLATWGRARDAAPGDFSHPMGITVDRAGYVYVADTDNNRIEKFDGDGRLLGIWGRYGHGRSELDSPHGIAVDARGNIFVADTFNHRLVKLSPSGRVLATLLVPRVERRPILAFHPVPHRAIPLLAWLHVFVH
jgi:DNA-binding beta-propeller fold protein YncE